MSSAARSSWWQRRKERRRERALERATMQLRDAFHYLDKWVYGWRRSPSEVESAEQAVCLLVRKVEALGGDALDLAPYRMDHLVEKAMPELFESVHNDWPENGWHVVRREVAA